MGKRFAEKTNWLIFAPSIKKSLLKTVWLCKQKVCLRINVNGWKTVNKVEVKQ